MNFYRLNKDYIEAFRKNVFSRYNSDDKRTETGLLRAILVEVNSLFRKIGGQISSKRKIPASGQFPDSEDFNELIQDIAFDIDKLYNAQKLVEADIQNLLNFNYYQRGKTFENFMTAQRLVYSAYVRSKKDIIGGVEVPDGNPFEFGEGTTNIFFDEDRGGITLAADTTKLRNIDSRVVAIYSAEDENQKRYPEGNTLGVGSHWKRSPTDVHFIDQTDSAEVLDYKSMLIDDPNSNIGVGFCEFELVETISNNIVGKIKEALGDSLSMAKESIYIDEVNSFQGKYMMKSSERIEPTESPKYKLVVPFSTNELTDQVVIEFTSNDEIQRFPSVVWGESKVFSNVGGTDVGYNLVPGPETSEDGRYVCKFTTFVYPTRLELVLFYSGNQMAWAHIPFLMSHFVYFQSHTYSLESSSTTRVAVRAGKQFDVFVDTEANEDNEELRAKNVLVNPTRQ